MRPRSRVLERIAVAILTAILCLPVPLRAEDQEEPRPSEGGILTGRGPEIDAGFGMAFDAVILRPVGFVALCVGATLFIPAAILAAPDPDALQEAKELFLTLPAQNVFSRPLGDF
jgi:hypothetical protein